MLTRTKLLERQKELKAQLEQVLMNANALNGALEQLEWDLAQFDEGEVSGEEVHGSVAEKAE